MPACPPFPIEWREVEARVSLAAIRGNLATLRALMPAGAACSVLVKSDAYGHGAVDVAQVALESGVEFLDVATVNEALELRNAGCEGDILVLGPILPHQADAAVRSDLVVCVGAVGVASALAEAALAASTQARVHLKIDTGMGRFGLRDDASDFARQVGAIAAMPGLSIEGALTHFAEADEPESDYTAAQLRRFARARQVLAEAGVSPRYVHAANSAGLIYHPGARFNLARIGIALYGAVPHARPLEVGRIVELQPAMSLVARVADIRELPAGASVSYGRRFVASRPTRLALIPAGYGNGYPRSATGRAEALVRGRRVPIVGTITMNLMAADATDAPEVNVGDEALLFGRLGDDVLPVEEVADAAGTISYEVLCNVGRSTPRVVVDKPSGAKGDSAP